MQEPSYIGPAIAGLGILVTIVLFLIGLLMRQGTKNNEILSSQQAETTSALNEQGRTLVELRTVLLGVNGTPGLVDRVNALHTWRNEQQHQALEEANRQIVELTRRAGDR